MLKEGGYQDLVLAYMVLMDENHKYIIIGGLVSSKSQEINFLN